MTEEQTIFYVLGRSVVLGGIGACAAITIFWLGGILSDATTVLSEKAKKIRESKEEG
jgi:hypothetical protein